MVVTVHATYPLSLRKQMQNNQVAKRDIGSDFDRLCLLTGNNLAQVIKPNALSDALNKKGKNHLVLIT